MRRLLVVVGTLVALASAGHGSAVAGTTRCTGEQTNPYNVRVECEVERVRRNERVIFPARPDCDRYRDFLAETTTNREGDWAYDSRSVPIPRFRLRDMSYNDEEAERTRYTLNVWVWADKKRIKFHNRSKGLVDISFSMRCQV